MKNTAKTSKQEIKIEIKGLFDKGHGVSNYDATEQLLDTFKAELKARLEKAGVFLSWVEALEPDEDNVVRLSLIEIDTGSCGIRALMMFVPIIGNITGPAASVEVEGICRIGGRESSMHAREEVRCASAGTKDSLVGATCKVAALLSSTIINAHKNLSRS